MEEHGEGIRCCHESRLYSKIRQRLTSLQRELTEFSMSARACCTTESFACGSIRSFVIISSNDAGCRVCVTSHH